MADNVDGEDLMSTKIYMNERSDVIETKVCENCNDPIIHHLCCTDNTNCTDCTEWFICYKCNSYICVECLYLKSGISSNKSELYCHDCSDKIDASRISSDPLKSPPTEY